MRHWQKFGPAVALIAALFSLAAAPAAAHSFNVAIVVPMSGAGKAALDGFKLAVRERDAHPDETADGHLGGLDVYVAVVDTGAGKAATLARIRELIETGRATFVAGIVPPDWTGALPRPPTPFIALGRLPPDPATTMDGEPFAAAFARRYGRAPTPPAIRGYGAARWIDRALRAVDEDLSDVAALREAMTRTAPK